jgi:4-hydroxy-3-polyprenylbenzoate decarboxylase
MDATIPFEWKNKPVEVRLDDAVMERIHARWAELGINA